MIKNYNILFYFLFTLIVFLYDALPIYSEDIRLSNSVKVSDSANEENSEAKSKGLKDALSSGNSKAPLFIKSDNLSLDTKERIFTYKDNVQVLQENMEITTDLMIGRYSEDNNLESILCLGNVVITKEEGMRASSNRAFYNIASAKIELTDEPELIRDGNALSADKITIFVDEDRSEADGNVRVKVLKAENGGSSYKMKGILSSKPSGNGDS